MTTEDTRILERMIVNLYRETISYYLTNADYLLAEARTQSSSDVRGDRIIAYENERELSLRDVERLAELFNGLAEAMRNKPYRIVNDDGGG